MELWVYAIFARAQAFVQILSEEEISEITSKAKNAMVLAEEKMLSGLFSEKTGKRICSALDNTLATFNGIKK